MSQKRGKGRGPPTEEMEQLSVSEGSRGRGRARGPPPGLGGRGAPPPGFGGPASTAGRGRAPSTPTPTPGFESTPGRSESEESAAPRGQRGSRGRAPQKRGTDRGRRPAPHEPEESEEPEEPEEPAEPETKGDKGITTTEPEEDTETTPSEIISETTSTGSEKKDKKDEKKEDKKEEKKEEKYEPLPHVRRPDLGKKGKPVQLVANMFPLQYDGIQAFLYDVKFEPEIKGRSTMRKLILHCASLEGLRGINPVYDGQALLFTAKAIPSKTWPLRFDVNEKVLDGKLERPPPKAPKAGGQKSDKPPRPPRPPKVFKISITPSSLGKGTGEIDTSVIKSYISGKVKEQPRLALQALDVAMRYGLQVKYFPIGRNIFYPEEEGFQTSLGGGAVLWLGHFQTVRACQAGLMLNVDTAATAMIEPLTLPDYLRARLGRNPEFPKDFNVALRALRGLRVYVIHRGEWAKKKKWRIMGLSRSPANKEMFDCQGTTTSVADYFKEKYQALKFPHFPCIKVGSKDMCLPMEVCRLEIGQRQKQGMSGQQRQVMITETCQSPGDRQNSIWEGCPDDKKDPYMKEFGVSIKKDMFALTGRVLPHPELKYLDERSGAPLPVQPRFGTWALKGVRFVNAKAIASCPIFIFGNEREQPTQFADGWMKRLAQTCGYKGLKWTAPIKVNRAENSAAGVQKVFQYLTNLKPKPQIVFCFLRSSKEHIYRHIKKFSETELGVVTQCVDYTKATHQKVGGPAYQANIALKMNAKLGGTHTIINGDLPLVSEKATLVMGADVHHPPPGNKTSGSISAVLGAVDKYCTMYSTVLQEQGHRVEHIQGMQKAAKWQLLNYQKARKVLPEQIIVYRDGVGEGHFDEIMSREVKAIRAACDEIDDGAYKPKITFLIVQKRNHVRFFLADPSQGDREGRLLAGTVVDNQVCSPHDFDFFMCSHAGLKGTSKPTHYHVLFDENKFSADRLLELTWDLCHIYQRCTRSVSYPAPAYYAHLASYRARLYTDDEDSDMSDIASQADSQAGSDKEVPKTALPQLAPSIANVLYFA